jgi:hypothetical protein
LSLALAWLCHYASRRLDSREHCSGPVCFPQRTWEGALSQPMDRSRLLVVVSAAQLASGVAGMVVALRRKHPYDVFWMHGQPEEIARDTIFKGTALSAPVSNLLGQAAMTAVVARRPSPRGEQALGGFGALLVAGYLGERLMRQRLRPTGWDALESPLLVIAIGLAAAMAILGLKASWRRRPNSPSLLRSVTRGT